MIILYSSIHIMIQIIKTSKSRRKYTNLDPTMILSISAQHLYENRKNSQCFEIVKVITT